MDFIGGQTGPGVDLDKFVSLANAFLYNPKGLQRWFTSFAYMGYKADGVTGAGGVDVACLSDSYGQGSGSNDIQGFGIPDHGAIQGWPNQLRLILQAALNPPGVIGGYGWWQMTRDGGVGQTVGSPDGCYASSGDLHLNRPFNGWNGSSGSGGGMGRQLHEFTAGAERWVRYNFNPRYFPVTHIKLCGFGTASFYLDVSPDPVNTSQLTKGAGTYAADHSALSGDTWGAFGPLVAINGGVTPPGNYTVQVDNNGADCYLSGFFMYNGDANCGVRVHNFSLGSSTAAMWANETVTQESVKQMGLTTADGITSVVQGSNGRLVIIMLGANDWQGRTKAQYKSDMAATVQAFQAMTSSPSILLVQQTPRFDGSADAWLQVMQFRDALKEICDDATMGAYTSLLDYWGMFNHCSPQYVQSHYGAIRSDNVHPSEGNGAVRIAQMIAAVLVPRSVDLKFAPVEPQS